MSFELREITLHGHRVAYRMTGSGPAIILIHGITSSSATWNAIAPMLADSHTVLGTDIVEMARGHASLADPESRSAFVQALRASVDPTGQRVRATDRLYLATQLPLLIVWGARDRVIPLEHGRRAHALVPRSRLVVF